MTWFSSRPFGVNTTREVVLCRQRIQQQTCGHRGRSGDPLYRVRRTLRTGYPLPNARQKARLEAVFAAHAHPDRRRGKRPKPVGVGVRTPSP